MYSAIKWSVQVGLVLGVFLAVAACSSDDERPTQPIESSGTGGPKKANAEVGCTKNEDCESNVCFLGNGQQFCTVRCTADNVAAVCGAPFTGSCNKQGYCKRD